MESVKYMNYKIGGKCKKQMMIEGMKENGGWRNLKEKVVRGKNGMKKCIEIENGLNEWSR